MSKDLVVYGAGPLAELMIRLFASAGRRVVGCVVDREYLSGARATLPVAPLDDLAARWPAEAFDLFVAVGYRRMRARLGMLDRARRAGHRLASFVSPTATASPGALQGENLTLLDRVVVEPAATVEEGCFLGAGVVVSHDARVERGAFLAAGAIVGGRATVGAGSFLGIGAVALNDVRLAPETHLLPGAYAYQDTEPMTRYAGNPARAISRHAERGIEVERG